MLWLLIREEVLNFRNVKAVMEQVKSKFSTRDAEIYQLAKTIKVVKKKTQKNVALYNSEVIEQDELQTIILPLRSQQKTIEAQIASLKGSDIFKGINDELIQNAIDNFTADVQYTDPETKKRAARTLFDSVIIHPKDKESGDRL